MPIEMEVCPKCKKKNKVSLVAGSHSICERCNYAWEYGDPNKLGWICPTHRKDLKATKTFRNIELFCAKCGAYYTAPENVRQKIKRAFLVQEEL